MVLLISKSSISIMDEKTDSSISSMEINPEQPQNSTVRIQKLTNFADLPEICLDKILSSFHIKELIKVSKTNLALRHSATRVFRMKYGKKKFEIKGGNERHMAQMIIHFGRQISNISLRFCAACPASDFRFDANIEKNLLKLIFDECSPILEELTICSTYGVPLCTPFPNLQKINYHITGCSIHPTWFQINQWFPTLQKISISDHYGKSELDEYLIHRMPNLKELWLFSNTSMIFSIHMAQIINTNRHIESLRIGRDSSYTDPSYNDDDFRKFQSTINWDDLMVSNLDIRQEGLIPIKIHLENVAKLKNLKSLALSADDYPNIDRFSFPLNKLLIETDGQNATTINFIVKQRSLEMLSIKIDSGLSSIYSKRIAEHLKNLTEISFVLNFVHPNALDFFNGLIEFVRHCKALKMISVTYIPSTEIPKNDDKIQQIRKMYTDLEAKISKMSGPDKWKLSYECKALDIEFTHLIPVRFLMALQASKHSYNFKFVNEF